MARPVIRSVDAQRNLDVLLAFAIAGVLGNRFFGLILWGGVRAAMRAEDRRVAAPVTPLASAAAGGLE